MSAMGHRHGACCRRDAGQSFVARGRRTVGNKRYVDVLQRQPDGLDAMAITGPSQLDIFWGASFATGDSKYVDQILNKIEEGINLPEFSVEDIVGVADATWQRNTESMKKLRQKPGDSEVVKLIPSGIALWGVASNVEQHDFIASAIERRINAEPGADLAYALQKILFQSRNKISSKADGRVINIMVSQTSENLPNQSLGDLMKTLYTKLQESVLRREPRLSGGFGKIASKYEHPVFL